MTLHGSGDNLSCLPTGRDMSPSQPLLLLQLEEPVVVPNSVQFLSLQ